MGAATDGGSSGQGSFYRPRDPRASPVYRLFESHFDEFERVYAERYQKRYGFWRPVIRKAVDAFLACGDLHEGFARARCADCGAEFFVAFSCKQRCMCASCHQKRTLLTGHHISENVCVSVPHRQFVFTKPKRFRRYFLFNRELLRKLPGLAWACLLQVYQAVLGRTDVVPGMIAAIQTHGRLSQWNSHLHALISAGAFAKDGTFNPLPEKLYTAPFLKLWEKKIFDLLLAEGRITTEVVEQIQSWRFSGFSVDHSVRLETGDTQGLERLAQYMVRCPFSVERVISVNEKGQVVYRAEKGEPFRYPLFGDPNQPVGVRRPFEVFEPLDFLAEITPHIPDPGMQLVRYFGWYSNKTRGQRKKQSAHEQSAHEGSSEDVEVDDSMRPSRKAARMRWAALIQRVFEVDPLKCQHCGGAMRIIAFIERKDQPQVVERILKHCGLWNPPGSRAPPTDGGSDEGSRELTYTPIEEEWLEELEQLAVSF